MRLRYNTVARILTIILSANMMLSAYAGTNLTGAGGTFPAPIYAKWADEYQQATGNKINYQGIGSSGGVKQIIAQTVDFGASDAPMKEEDLKKYHLFQFPTVIGGVVLAVNIPNIKSGQLILDGKTVGDIYLGNIKKWNDPAISAINPRVKLPDSNINVIRRADGSGTSFVFTSYLSKVNKEWSTKIGKGNTVNWPTGLGGKGNDGVAAFVQRLPGSIGYVEYAYAKQSHLSFTKLIDYQGKAINPSEISFANAAKSVDWNKSFAQDLTFQKSNDAWPITSTTFILIHKKQINKDKGIEILKFFDWVYKNGSKTARMLDYTPLPESVTAQIRAAWKVNIKDSLGNTLFNN